MGETGIREHFGQQFCSLPSSCRKRRIPGIMQFFRVANEEYEGLAVLDLTQHPGCAEPESKQKPEKRDAGGKSDGSMSHSHQPDLREV